MREEAAMGDLSVGEDKRDREGILNLMSGRWGW